MLAGFSSPARRASHAIDRLRSMLVLVVALTLLAGPAAGAQTPAAIAQQAPSVAAELVGDDRVLAGETGTLQLSATGAGEWGYNLALVLRAPTGLVPLNSALGLPRVIADPDDAGYEFWIFEDVADLPAGGVYDLDVEVGFTQPPMGTGQTNDPAVFPVGSLADIELATYTSSDPNLLPWFVGSSAADPAASAAVTVSDTDDHDVELAALRVTKTEPSPESELVRGVHAHPTEYTITVENTTEGTTEDAVVVDYLPAGLEFLGCGGIDNTTSSPAGDGTTHEYPGSGGLEDTPTVTDCIEPVEVLTVQGDPNAPSDAVYTRVTWQLGALEPGSTTEIVYAAAIPLYENTLEFAGDDAPDGPSGASLGQAANLDNNNGPATRQLGGHDPAGDGIGYENLAEAAGTYQGVVRTGTDRAVSDDDEEIVIAMDLAVLKGVEEDVFVAGQAATYYLDLRTSEYSSSDGIVLTDTVPNGLCPVTPAGTPTTGDVDQIPPFCQPTDDHPTNPDPIAGATAVELNYVAATGTFTLVLEPTDQPMAASTARTITYPVAMRPDYTDGQEHGPTTSMDVFTNEVTVTGTTTSIPPLQDEDWFPETEEVWDDSAAELTSEPSSISKRVAPRDDVADAPADPCPTAAGAYSDDDEPGFRMGDVACFELSVDFPGSVQTRNPVVTDVLPVGFLDFVDWAPADAASAALLEDDAFSQDQRRLEWQVGIVGAGDDRYVPAGATLRLLVWAEVTEPAVGITVDKPANLMQYRQENVDGEVFFLRDEAIIDVEPGVSLLKGVRDVDGVVDRPATSQGGPDGSVVNSNRDGIQVVEGEAVTYRVDLTAPGYLAASDMVVWDSLPAGIACADVEDHTGTAVAMAACYDPTDAGFPDGLSGVHATRSVVIWTDVAVAATSTATLLYTVEVPTGTSVSTELDNTASIISYLTDTNVGGTQPYYPDGSLDTTLEDDWNAPGDDARDDSWIYLPDAVVDKGATTVDAAYNVDGQAVTGELITYVYSVTVPGNTTVYDGVLSDTPADDISLHEVVGATLDDGPLPTGFTLGADGTLTFPATYTNATDDPQVFAVTITAFVASGHDYDHGNLVGNTATFTSNATLGGDPLPPVEDTTTVEYVEPDPQITKVADPAEVAAEAEVTFTLTVTNADGRPTTFDTVVTDCVPEGLAVDEDSITGGGVIVVDDDCDGTTIQWQLGAVAADDDPIELAYTVVVDPAAGGGASYTNVAEVDGFTLPEDPDSGDRDPVDDDTTETITVVGPQIAKDVAPSTATIGTEVEYVVEVTLPADVNFYDASIDDVVPAGIAMSDATCDAPAGVTCVGPDPQSTSGEVATTVTWDLGTIASAPTERTVTITYTGTVADTEDSTDTDPDPVDGDDLLNTAAFIWVTTPGGDDEHRVQDDATVTVVEPDLVISKLVDGADHQDVEPGDTFTYTVEVGNVGTSDAFNVTVVDDIPLGVVVDADTITGGGQLADADAERGNGTITWTLDELAVDETTTFEYEATLAPSGTLDTATLQNVATVDEYVSLPDGDNDDGRRDYTGPSDDATVTPQFPFVTVAKAATDGTSARVGDGFSWTITVESVGDADAHDVMVVDTLPYGWYYDDTVEVRIDDVPVLPTPEPTVDVDTDGRTTLVWLLEGVLAVDQVATIEFTSEPTTDAYEDPGAGVGIDNAHVNDVLATADDPTGASGNEDGPYAGPPADADAFLVATNVTIDKDRVGTDEVFAGDEVTFDIVVTNTGDQPAEDVIVTDTLPAGLTFDGVDPEDRVVFDDEVWDSCEILDGTVTCVLADDLAPDATASFTLTARTTATAVPEVVNVAEVTTTTPETNPDDNTSEEPVPVTPSADLRVIKGIDGDPVVVAGERITWTIDVRNLGPSTSVAPITVTDTLPDDVLDVQVTADGWVCEDVEDQILTCVLTDDLPVDTDAPRIEIDALVDPSLEEDETLTNVVVVESTTHDPQDDNNEDTSTTEPSGALTDLVLTKTLVGDELVAGEAATYRLEVENLGPSDARNVTIVDTLPDGLTFVEVVGTSDDDEWTCAEIDDEVHCELRSGDGILPAGSSTWLEFEVLVASSVTDDTLTNVAVVDTTTEETDPSNNDDTVTSPVTVVTNLSITKTHDGETRRVGDEVTFTLSVTNHGPADASDVVLEDVLPDGLTFEGVDEPFVTDDGWVCDVEDDTLTCELDAFPVDPDAPTRTVEVTALVTPAAHPSVTNGVTVTTETTETTLEDNEDDETVTVDPLVDLAVVKSVDLDELEVGGTASYTIAVTNTGPTDDPGPVTIVDVLPEGLTLADHSGAGCEIADREVTCELGAIAVDETVTVTLDVEVGPAAYPQVTNVVEVRTPSEDTDPDNNDDEVTTPVLPDLGVAIDKQVANVDGDEVTWAVTVTNTGLNTLEQGVVVTDELPDGLRYVGVTGDGFVCTVDGQRVTCVHEAPLEADASVSMLLVTTVTAPEGTSVENVATVRVPDGPEVLSATDDAVHVVPVVPVDPDPVDPVDPARPAPDPTPPSRSPGWLPRTGAETWLLVAIAAGLLTVGTTITRVTRRRHGRA